jgi:hypothetical protein
MTEQVTTILREPAPSNFSEWISEREFDFQVRETVYSFQIYKTTDGDCALQKIWASVAMRRSNTLVEGYLIIAYGDFETVCAKYIECVGKPPVLLHKS